MRNILIGLAFLISAPLMAANPPQKQKVYSIVKQQQSLQWYEEQLMLWEAELKKDPKNAEAWLNVYTATRMIKLSGGKKTKDDLDKVVNDAEKSIPETFEYNYMRFYNGNHEEALFKYLLKAHEIDPNRPETFDDFVGYYEIKRDREQVKSFCEKWFASNDMSEGLLAWNYNMLMSCDENAILITCGDNDTYPALVLQHAKKIRADVSVLNLSLLLIDSYRDLYFSEMGIPKFTPTSEGDFTKFGQEVCAHIQKNSSRPFFYANTVEPKFYSNVKDDLYSVGLAYKYSKEGFDNVAVLRKNYEKRFVKDNLKIGFTNDISQGVVDNLNSNYLVPFITLHNHYSETEEKESLENLTQIIGSIAERVGQAEEVNKIINQSGNNVVSYVIDDPREVYRGFVKINEQLHAAQYETSTFMYNKFLEDLLKQKRYTDIMVAKQENVNWDALLMPVDKGLKNDQYFLHGKPGDDLFPVCNVSYEAAVLYCDWMTNVYNNLEHRKKQFKKVKFRLPNEKEWEMLAHGGKAETNKFPWDGEYLRNSGGCYLANIQTGASQTDPAGVCKVHYDGGIFPVNNNSYHPNDFGLFCTIGNVAEMVSEKGIAKGGGWNTPGEEATIKAQQKYTGPDANVGFRVVMEVIEK
ncbi:MAG TPA: SUMF1/EgtB/PvdO family nonheme iron enzyme [Flavobacteriales bacterium]|nr:SUMF1/EgtB/PvdO family nonheme iron enzyme [Flavobacteriales bacterium]